MFGYDTDNLYIGGLGLVSKKNGNCMISKIDYVIAFRIKTIDGLFKEKIGIDINTGKKYYFLRGNKYDSDTVERAIGSYAIGNYVPIEKYLDYPKKRVSKKEIIKILDSYNNKDNFNEKEKVETEEVKDSILQMIIDTNDLVKKSSISEDLKKSLYNELTIMAENYASELINYHKRKDANPFESEYQIKMKYMKLLVSIEQACNDIDNQKAYSLTKQLNKVKEELNKN